MKRMQAVDPAELKYVPTFSLQLVGAGQPLLHVSRDGLHALSLWLGLLDDADTWTKPTLYPRQELMSIKVFPSQPPFPPDQANSAGYVAWDLSDSCPWPWRSNQELLWVRCLGKERSKI